MTKIRSCSVLQSVVVTADCCSYFTLLLESIAQVVVSSWVVGIELQSGVEGVNGSG